VSSAGPPLGPTLGQGKFIQISSVLIMKILNFFIKSLLNASSNVYCWLALNLEIGNEVFSVRIGYISMKNVHKIKHCMNKTQIRNSGE
jgi:hypothetical protein